MPQWLEFIAMLSCEQIYNSSAVSSKQQQHEQAKNGKHSGVINERKEQPVGGRLGGRGRGHTDEAI